MSDTDLLGRHLLGKDVVENLLNGIVIYIDNCLKMMLFSEYDDEIKSTEQDVKNITLPIYNRLNASIKLDELKKKKAHKINAFKRQTLDACIAHIEKDDIRDELKARTANYYSWP